MWLDLCSGDLDADRTESGDSWGPERTVEARTLVDALTRPDTPARGAVRIRGARITGILDLSRTELACPLQFERCYFDEEVLLDESRIPTVSLDGCRLPALSAYQLETRGDVDLVRTTTGWVDVSGAKIGGAFGLNRVTLTSNRDSNALNASRIRVDGDMLCRELTIEQGALGLMGGHIGGELNLNGAALANENGRALHGDGLRVDANIWASAHGPKPFRADGEVRLIGANAGRELNFSGARLINPSGDALDADRLRVEGDAIFEHLVAHGEIRMVGASIAGQLRFGGARIINLRALRDPEDARALSADAVNVERGLVCKKLQALGQVRLLSARIEGPLSFDDARLANPMQAALVADGVRVNGTASFKRMSMDLEGLPAGAKDRLRAGEVRLVDARISVQLHFDGAHLVNPDGDALTADFLHVGGTAYFRDNFTADKVRFAGAHVGGQLLLDDATVQQFWLNGLQADELWLPQARKPDRFGVVVLTDVHVRVFSDQWKPATSPYRYRPILAGFAYESLATDSQDLTARLDWLTEAGDRNPEAADDEVPESGKGYLPQAYDQLEAVLRRAGREKDARHVAIEKQRRRRKSLSLPGQAFSLAADLLVGYGYRTYRAAAALTLLIAASMLVFALADRAGDMQPLKAQAEAPEFHWWLYALDAVLPIVSFGQEGAWSPQGLALAWYACAVIMGWLLATAVVAALTASLFRE